MKEQWKAGVSFGLTSGAITTMGLMVGLHSGTHDHKPQILKAEYTIFKLFKMCFLQSQHRR